MAWRNSKLRFECNMQFAIYKDKGAFTSPERRFTVRFMYLHIYYGSLVCTVLELSFSATVLRTVNFDRRASAFCFQSDRKIPQLQISYKKKKHCVCFNYDLKKTIKWYKFHLNYFTYAFKHFYFLYSIRKFRYLM